MVTMPIATAVPRNDAVRLNAEKPPKIREFLARVSFVGLASSVSWSRPFVGGHEISWQPLRNREPVGERGSTRCAATSSAAFSGATGGSVSRIVRDSFRPLERGRGCRSATTATPKYLRTVRTSRRSCDFCKETLDLPTKRLLKETPMRLNRVFLRTALWVAAFADVSILTLHADHALRAVLPDAIVDLRTVEGVARLNAQWRYSDTAIREIDHRDVGADLKASGPENRTLDFSPDARAADFDDTRWEVIPATSLEQRRGHGRLSFNWYRLSVIVPEKVGSFDTRGSTAVFEIVVDDYAEVWVNGKAPFVLGQNGGSVAAGWNAPNRVVLTRDARPGDKFQIAVLGINGPISVHPDTYIWVRSATLDFYSPGKLSKVREVKLDVDRQDSALDGILPVNAKLEKLADGFAFTEGPVWVDARNPAIAPDSEEGFLLFSDPNNNAVYRMHRGGDVK